MNILDAISIFTYAYPSVMATIWICGGLYFYLHWERKQAWPAPQIWDEACPNVTLLLPCYNEAANIRETIEHLKHQNYPKLEIIAINDGSRDATGELLESLKLTCPNLKVLHQSNQGKASALNHGLEEATGEIIVGIDGDAILDYDAIGYMVGHFLQSSNVSGVTGNPRVRTRSTVIGKIQTGEFSSIIGLIKRAQRIYGMVFTISGVVCAFRRSALEAIDGWNTDMITEDIDISWRLQMAGGQVRYEPRALCWVLMPETLRGLFRQRLRWAQGGAEVFLRYFTRTVRWQNRRFWPLMLEYMVSVVWCYSALFMLLSWLFSLAFLTSSAIYSGTLLTYIASTLIILSFIQFTVSFAIDSRYERGMLRCAYWCVWYPLIYWLLNMATVVLAVPKAAKRQKGRLATWTSPDRGEIFHE
ncbi:poly-beta-1,6-N-acetyl-D-glucosamine synthase [Billgrantia ethanolica]|uniref:Poly-beta-1,6-N-acetyl-D-glucosamine synthase n=1 Tax=Billgrantia ethanolica TaxID=2733486 RepID=A0ABS9A7L3_9GAMM|nr:poly-beta-1,6-N-acetyl-D-glucosamine synthase [Halomonas ethanolica]MCE8004814.1 poly-beta-1,6 N-acetyl-D-glucosamine synthase [Halomonas ethanolica]